MNIILSYDHDLAFWGIESLGSMIIPPGPSTKEDVALVVSQTYMDRKSGAAPYS